MVPEDLERVVRIEREAFSAPWGLRFFMDELNCGSALNEVLLNLNHIRPSAGRSRHSHRDRPIDAYICARLVAGEMQILKIAVAADCRRQGMASWILRQSLQKASEQAVRAVFLETRVSNTAALNLYHKLGFGIIDKRPGYYADNQEDALVMMKTT